MRELRTGFGVASSVATGVALAMAAMTLAVAVVIGVAAPAAAVEPNFQVCAGDFPFTPLQRVIYATDAGSGTRIDAIVGEGYLNGERLENTDTDGDGIPDAYSWDFSGLTGDDRVLQIAPVDPAWSCSVMTGTCNRFAAAQVLLVQDNYPAPSSRDINALFYDMALQTVYLRSQVLSEGISPDEVRVCFAGDIDFLRFPQPGGCVTEGDTWSSSPSCDDVNQDDPCGTAGPDAGVDGELRGRAVRNGTLTLPSGHVVDAVLVEIWANFDIRILGCLFPSGQTLQQYLLLWLIPHYGPIAQLSSPGGSTDLLWETVGSTTIGSGLLPPVCAQVDDVTADSITVSWDPGVIPGGFGPDAFVVHWGNTPSMPDSSTDDIPVTIPVSQTSYTISGLMPNTDYCVSVTSRADYTDPVSMVTTTYDSISLPDAVGADIDGDGTRDTSYPVEVCVRTGGTPPMPSCGAACGPLGVVANLFAVKEPPVTGADVRFTWTGDPNASDGHTVYTVPDKSDLPLIPGGPATAACMAPPPMTSCVDPGAVPPPPSWKFYDVRGVCGMTVGP